VYYLSPDGKITRLFEPNRFVSPNGILLSPDGKILYVNNTTGTESWYQANRDKGNYIWAYDVNDDGTVSNGRLFGKLFVTEDVLDRGGRDTGADGMTIDKMGNIYVATSYGVQIINAKGEYVGMINLPTYPVSCCFGDDDMKSLYIVSYSWVFKIRTNMEGFIQYR
jgi:gluconolactonase